MRAHAQPHETARLLDGGHGERLAERIEDEGHRLRVRARQLLRERQRVRHGDLARPGVAPVVHEGGDEGVAGQLELAQAQREPGGGGLGLGRLDLLQRPDVRGGPAVARIGQALREERRLRRALGRRGLRLEGLHRRG